MNGEYENKTENLIAAAIDMAEDVRDPLEGLVEKTSTDPGAPFVPDALERIAALKGVRGAAGAVEECRLPGDCARRSHC
jgi:hypothetical protein